MCPWERYQTWRSNILPGDPLKDNKSKHYININYLFNPVVISKSVHSRMSCYA